MHTGLQEIITTLLESLDQRKGLKSIDSHTQDMLDRALDRVLQGTDNKINLVPNYRQKLYQSIIRALQYADNMVEQIPQPIELTDTQLVSNPYVRAFFYTTTGLKKVCNQSSELKEFFQEPEHAQTDESCALLCMQKIQKNVLGMQLQGDRVIKDVQKSRITFVDHHIQSPAINERIARRELKCCIFEGLINNALANISALRAKRQQLETEQQILSSKLRSHNQGIVSNEITYRNETLKLAKIEQQLHKIGYITPEASLHQVNATLNHPEKFAQLKNIALKLDKEGILRSDHKHSSTINKVHLSEVSIKGQAPRVVTLVRIKRDGLTFPKTHFPHSI